MNWSFRTSTLLMFWWKSNRLCLFAFARFRDGPRRKQLSVLVSRVCLAFQPQEEVGDWWEKDMWVFPKIGVPQNGLMESPIRMDDLVFSHTFGNIQIVPWNKNTKNTQTQRQFPPLDGFLVHRVEIQRWSTPQTQPSNGRHGSANSNWTNKRERISNGSSLRWVDQLGVGRGFWWFFGWRRLICQWWMLSFWWGRDGGFDLFIIYLGLYCKNKSRIITILGS